LTPATDTLASLPTLRRSGSRAKVQKRSQLHAARTPDAGKFSNQRVAIGFAPANSSASEVDTQQIYGILLKMLDRWNAHDIDGYMEVYWKSPELLVVVDAEQFNGWQLLHDSYINGYSDRIAMGFIQPKRIQIKLLKPDLALTITWWSVSFPSSKQEMVGNSTMNLQKFEDGWKIVASHTSVAGM
jgi:hypothetical protein